MKCEVCNTEKTLPRGTQNIVETLVMLILINSMHHTSCGGVQILIYKYIAFNNLRYASAGLTDTPFIY